jgi:hypothetical protein
MAVENEDEELGEEAEEEGGHAEEAVHSGEEVIFVLHLHARLACA